MVTHHADVDGDLVLVDGNAQELVDGVRVGRETRCLLNGRVAEDPGRHGRDGHQESDGRHHLDQRCGQPEVAEEQEVQHDAHGGRRDQHRQDRSRRDAPILLGVEEIEEACDEVRHRAEREVQDSRRGVGDHQAGRRNGVDAAQYQSGDHELQHLRDPPLLLPAGSAQRGISDIDVNSDTNDAGRSVHDARTGPRTGIFTPRPGRCDPCG